jgi:hypothetical protein
MNDTTMKNFRILALVPFLALALTVSLQAQTDTQTDTTTTSTQSTETQSTDQTAPAVHQQAPTVAPDPSMEDQSTTSNTDTNMSSDPNQFSDPGVQSSHQDDYSQNPYWIQRDIIDNNDSGAN